MIKASELRMGNIVGFYKSEIHELQIGTVDEVSANYDEGGFNIRIPQFSRIPLSESGITGIPLTEEWPARLGVDYFEISKQAMGYSITVKIDNAVTTFFVLKKPDYVHEFQNLIFALTGTELEYKP